MWKLLDMGWLTVKSVWSMASRVVVVVRCCKCTQPGEPRRDWVKGHPTQSVEKAGCVSCEDR